jgi:thioredoxin-related protein
MRRILPALFLLLVTASAFAQLRMVLDTPIYNDNADAKEEIQEALGKAQHENKRVLLVFGANWCYDCHVLDYRFHEPNIQPLLDKSFVVVHVDIGRGEKNADLAKQYKIPLDRGVPAIAVVDKAGVLLFSQQQGEFEKARSLPEQSFVTFLKQWAPQG